MHLLSRIIISITKEATTIEKKVKYTHIKITLSLSKTSMPDTLENIWWTMTKNIAPTLQIITHSILCKFAQFSIHALNADEINSTISEDTQLDSKK